jgi:ribosomal protein L44E
MEFCEECQNHIKHEVTKLNNNINKINGSRLNIRMFEKSLQDAFEVQKSK